ncbi:MAG: TonB-dependent receptor [Sediminibacterium sp.]|nr:TonB-dependent receptor [Sediminibacterium sp.]MDP3127756.1 TonB-dependent receptor [Sediminibacterium sp.]
MFEKQNHIILSLTFVLLAFCLQSKAQTDTTGPLITAEFKNIPVETFLLDIESRTGFHFYYKTADFDSLKIDVSVNNEPWYKVLSLAFMNTGLIFAKDHESHIFISKQVTIKTSLPDDFFDDALKKNKKVTLNAAHVNNDTSDTEKIAVGANLENKLYFIGVKPKGNLLPGKVTIAGYLHDIKTGEPLYGASVVIEGTKTGVLSDQYGYYSLTIPKGRNIINIQSMGIRDTRRQLMVYSEGRMNIDLQPQVISLKNVVVSAERTSLVRGMQMGVQKIDIKSIKQVPVAFGETDILRVVMTMPGVKTIGEASTGLNVRGGASDQNLILFNDATIFNPSHFFGLFSAFNPEVVKDLQLYKSGIPAKYGGRLSSVLEVNSREGNKKEITGSAGIGLLTSRINIEGPLVKDKSSFIFGARTTYANWLLNMLPNEYKNSRAAFNDINFNITHEINKQNSIYFTGYMSNDQFNLNNDTSYHYGNRNISLKWKHVFNNKWYAIAASGYDGYNYDISSERNPSTAYKLAFDINQYYLKTHVNYFANAKHTIEFGMNHLLYKLHPGKYAALGNQSFIKSDEMQAEQAVESAFYLSDKFTVSPDLSLEGAVRYTIFNSLGAQTVNNYASGIPKTESNILGTSSFNKGQFIKTYHGPEIRATARYVINETLSIKAGYNTQKQFIHVLSNTGAIAPTDIWKLSDPNIRPQSGDQLSLGIYKNLKSNTIETSLEVYYKHMNDYLDYKSGAVLVLNHHIETDVLATRGKAYGIELLIRKSTGKFNGWFSYTYARTLLQMNDNTQGAPINKGVYYPANYDKPHDVTFVGNVRVSHRFSISLNTTYSTGRPITLPIGRFFYGGAERTVYSDRNQYRIPDYFRCDFSMNIEGNHKVHQLFHNSFTIGVYNLTAKKNPYSVYFSTENGVVNGYKLSIFGTAIPYINYNIRF